jgi:hypothetical protein
MNFFEIIGVVTGSIISICSIIVAIFSLMKCFFYSKIDGCLLSLKIDMLTSNINELKDLLQKGSKHDYSE